MPSGSAPSPEAIETWIAHEKSALEAIQAQLRPLLDQERQISDRLARLKDLLSAYSGSNTGYQAAGGPSTGISLAASTKPQSVAERVRGQVEEILKGSDGPMHILDIHAGFEQRGWPVPGAGKPANITAHLSGAANIVSPQRGFYRLLAQGEAPPEPSAQKKRTTKRRRAQTKK